MRLEAEYAAALSALTTRVARWSLQSLMRHLPGILAGSVERTDDDRLDAGDKKKQIDALIGQAKRLVTKASTANKVETVGKTYSTRVAGYHKAQLNRQHQAQFGTDVQLKDKKVSEKMKSFVRENVSYITKMQTNVHDEIEEIILNALDKGKLYKDIADDIEERFNVSESHARLIARDQVGKLYGQINADRQKELGVRKFIWRSVKDERVRDEHDQREKESDPAHGGTPYSYDDPPDDELPGEPIQCRCYAEPVFSSIAADDDEDE